MDQLNFYRTPDGKYLQDRHAAMHVTPQDVVDEIRALYSVPHPPLWTASNGDWSGFIHEKYFVGTAERESGFAVNEVDVEPSGFTSRGIFQISNGYKFTGGGYDAGDDELRRVGLSGEHDLLDLKQACLAMLLLAEANRVGVLKAAGRSTILATATDDDVLAYMGLAHNEGLHAAEKTIQAHGLDRIKYKRRNGCCGLHTETNFAWDMTCSPVKCTPYGFKIGRYMDACSTGGSRYREVK